MILASCRTIPSPWVPAPAPWRAPSGGPQRCEELNEPRKPRQKGQGLAGIKASLVTNDVPYYHGVPAGSAQSPSSALCADAHRRRQLGCVQAAREPSRRQRLVLKPVWGGRQEGTCGALCPSPVLGRSGISAARGP